MRYSEGMGNDQEKPGGAPDAEPINDAAFEKWAREQGSFEDMERKRGEELGEEAAQAAMAEMDERDKKARSTRESFKGEEGNVQFCIDSIEDLILNEKSIDWMPIRSLLEDFTSKENADKLLASVGPNSRFHNNWSTLDNFVRKMKHLIERKILHPGMQLVEALAALEESADLLERGNELDSMETRDKGFEDLKSICRFIDAARQHDIKRMNARRRSDYFYTEIEFVDEKRAQEFTDAMMLILPHPPYRKEAAVIMSHHSSKAALDEAQKQFTWILTDPSKG